MIQVRGDRFDYRSYPKKNMKRASEGIVSYPPFGRPTGSGDVAAAFECDTIILTPRAFVEIALPTVLFGTVANV